MLRSRLNTVLRGIQSKDAGSIAGVFTTMQQISGAIGVALIGILFFGQLAINANVASQQPTPVLRQELQAQGLSSAAIDQVASAFHICFQDRATGNDSTVQPESCQRLANEQQFSQQAQTAMFQATDSANAFNYAHAFVVSVWFNIGLLLITLLLTYWLPRQASVSRLVSLPE